MTSLGQTQERSSTAPPRPAVRAGRFETVLVSAALGVGVAAGILLDSFLLGFLALAVVALAARLLLGVVGSRGSA